MPDVFALPGLGEAKEEETLMQAFTGNGAAFDAAARRFSDFQDGAVATIFFAVAAKGVPWTKPADMPFDPKANPADQLLKSPLGAYLAVMADRTPKALGARNSAETMRALVTVAGGERVTPELATPPAP